MLPTYIVVLDLTSCQTFGYQNITVKLPVNLDDRLIVGNIIDRQA
ncbi:hypothetical protein ACP6PL_25050 [Dapis sp. BLCC M126]